MNAVIIDFDGTIADSFEYFLNYLLAQAKRAPNSLTIEERAAVRGMTLRQVALYVGVPSWRLPILYFQGKAYMTKRIHAIPPFPGMEDVLAAIHRDGYQIYIISSNSRRNIMRFLTQHGFSGYFRQVYGDVGWFGKAPALKRALRQNGLQTEDAIYIGDEVRDIVGASAVGMASVAVTWGFGSEDQLLEHNPTVVVRNPDQLKKLLLDWNKT